MKQFKKKTFSIPSSRNQEQTENDVRTSMCGREGTWRGENKNHNNMLGVDAKVSSVQMLSGFLFVIFQY